MINYQGSKSNTNLLQEGFLVLNEDIILQEDALSKELPGNLLVNLGNDAEISAMMMPSSAG